MTLPQNGVRTGNCARKNIKLRNAIAIATGAALSSVGQVSAAAEVEEVVVVGVRQSLETAQEIKREADTFVDSITATDIGAFPDKSVAEALQRVPGITVSRLQSSDDSTHFSAEPASVLIRGLTFVRTEFNGRDSFSADGYRGLNFNDISPELMAGVDSYKNQTADMIEGGIAGSVNLRTRLPFDSDDEPNRLGDVSYARPGKYVGIWWEMHLNRSTWGSGPQHGATTANARRYVDFAAKHGFDGVLVEGWNAGWDGDWIANGAGFSFTHAYPDFDLAEVTAYARSKGVSLIGHNETAGAIANYEAQMVAGFEQYAKYGVHSVKTGYVKPNGTIQRLTSDGQSHNEWFAGQYLVRHHQLVAETAAKYKISIDAHEPVKDTGLRRTYPNLMTREGARGQEFNAWGNPTNPPEHVTILPFTRLLAGPMDFTPGIFDITAGKREVQKRVQSTLANQLALYVVIYSPLHMAADLPENYEKHPEAFQFIKDVPTDWERSRTLDARIGDYVVVARQQRGGEDWYLGAVTDEQPRSLSVALGFLQPGRKYEAQIYRDETDADYRTNALAQVIERRTVSSTDRLSLALGPGGGAAIRFKVLH